MIHISAHVQLVGLETLQVKVKGHWQHTYLKETLKSSKPEFYDLSQVLCREHYISMYLGEYSPNFDFL